MKRLTMIVAMLATASMVTYCRKKVDELPKLVGQPGNPRFNLQFTNEANVDLDLHVLDPNGEEIYYANPAATKSKGQLDVDCLCGDCTQGPNENIFWPVGAAPTGSYKVWVEYYGDCSQRASNSSDFTLRVVQNETIIATYTGTLKDGRSIVWAHQQR